MSCDEKLVERVRKVLSQKRKVTEKRMIGGLCFMVNGSMCCGVTSSGLMVRVGAEARERTLAQTYVRPMKFAGKPLAGFVCVDPAGCRTDAQLAAWVQRSVDFVSTLSAKKSVARKSRPKTQKK